MSSMLQIPRTRRVLHSTPKPLRACAGASTQNSQEAALVTADTPACPADSTMARLLIHATQAPDEGGGALALLLRRLRPWATAATRCPLPADLRIVDLDGRAYFTADELPPVTDLPLPAGIYHVTVSHGSQQRGYTLALGQGVAFHLHLRAD